MTGARPPIAPPSAIGVLGGGQLGRYTVVAALLAGYRTVVLDPDPAAPAGAVADHHLVARYDDDAAVDELARRCRVVTTEFENPPARTLRRLEQRTLVAPSGAAVAIAQDRIAEKAFLTGIDAPVAPYAAVVEAADLAGAAAIGVPAILKTARLGYDGKGQRAIAEPADVAAAWEDVGRLPCVVERRVPLDAEVSVVLARAADGNVTTYPLAENHHRDGILDLTIVPARVRPWIAEQANALATRIADRLGYVGVLAVELFVSAGQLLVNELAPRPHNSGHWTLDAAVTDQFAQQLRAATGAALGASTMTTPAVAMANLLGDLWRAGAGSAEPSWAAVLDDRRARLHLYGKAAARPGRKMGHLTVLGDDVDEVAGRARRLRAGLLGKPAGDVGGSSATMG